MSLNANVIPCMPAKLDTISGFMVGILLNCLYVSPANVAQHYLQQQDCHFPFRSTYIYVITYITMYI